MSRRAPTLDPGCRRGTVDDDGVTPCRTVSAASMPGDGDREIRLLADAKASVRPSLSELTQRFLDRTRGSAYPGPIRWTALALKAAMVGTPSARPRSATERAVTVATRGKPTSTTTSDGRGRGCHAHDRPRQVVAGARQGCDFGRQQKRDVLRTESEPHIIADRRGRCDLELPPRHLHDGDTQHRERSRGPSPRSRRR